MTAFRTRQAPCAVGAVLATGSLAGVRMRLCYVVHRYAPYPGGSETYVKALAEESLRRGHEVWVYTGLHQGDLNGVRVTSDERILETRFDLIIVHAGVHGAQSFVLSRCAQLPSPVLYLLVSHDGGGVIVGAMRSCAAIGCSTPDDRKIALRYGLGEKCVEVRHGVDPETSTGRLGFKAKFGIPSDVRVFLSCGGYWPHKRMKPLARLFERARTDAILVTTGYHALRRHMPARSQRVLPLLLESRADALSAIREADCVLMHSRHEGFGLVLLEAMLNRTPWIAHEVGAATQLKPFGDSYTRDDELIGLIERFRRDDARVERAAQFVAENHLISHSVDDIEAAALTVRSAPAHNPRRDARFSPIRWFERAAARFR